MSTYTGSSISSLNTTTPTIKTGEVKELDDAVRQIKRFLRESGSGTLVDLMYPVGMRYESFTSNNPSVDIQTRHGLSAPFGIWVKLSGVTLIAHQEGDFDFGTVIAPIASNELPQGGEKTHTLIEDELPAHTHSTEITYTTNTSSSGNLESAGGNSGTYNYESNTTGGDQPHNNLPPYRVHYVWVRTA